MWAARGQDACWPRAAGAAGMQLGGADSWLESDQAGWPERPWQELGGADARRNPSSRDGRKEVGPIILQEGYRRNFDT